MPTDLQRRLLSTLIDDLDIDQFRTLVMHVAGNHLELAGEEALRIKKESQDRQPALLEPSGSRIEIQPRQILLSESPTIESDLESHTKTDDGGDDDYIPHTTTSAPSTIATRPTRPVVFKSRSRVRRTTKSTGRPTIILPSRSKSARLHKLLHGLVHQWSVGTRNDSLNRYNVNNEYLASGWPAIVDAHGKRLQRYLEGFRGTCPAKKQKVRNTVIPSVMNIIPES